MRKKIFGGWLLLVLAPSAFSQPSQDWVQRYNASINDVSTAMTVDRFGNVYVTGIVHLIACVFACGEGPEMAPQDYLTVKYNAAGALQWAATYNGTGNAQD